MSVDGVAWRSIDCGAEIARRQELQVKLIDIDVGLIWKEKFCELITWWCQKIGVSVARRWKHRQWHWICKLRPWLRSFKSTLKSNYMRCLNQGNLPENSHEAAVLTQNFWLIHFPQRFRLDCCRVSWLTLVLNRFKETNSDLINEESHCVNFNWSTSASSEEALMGKNVSLKDLPRRHCHQAGQACFNSNHHVVTRITQKKHLIRGVENV